MVRARMLATAGFVAALAAVSGCVFDQLFSPDTAVSVAVTITVDSVLVVGDTVPLSVAVTSEGQPFTGYHLRFTTSRPGVAVADSSGRVAVLARDTFSITVEVLSGSLGGDPPMAVANSRGIAARVLASADSVHVQSLTAEVALGAAALTRQGDTIPATVTWSSADPSTVGVDGTGTITANQNGTVSVVAELDGRTDTVTVMVRQETRTIVIAPETVTLATAGETVQLTADARDSLGQINVATPVSWSVTSPQVLSVDATGLVTALTEAIAGVVAASDSVADTARVVVSRAMTSLTVTSANDTLDAISDTTRLTASGVDTAGNNVGSPVVEWTSLDANVATVDTAGLVTAVTNGDARLVGLSGGARDTAVVTVQQRLAGVVIAVPAAETTLTSFKDTAQFIAEGRDGNGFAIAGIAFTWSSTRPEFATVDGDGLVVAEANGFSDIRAAAGGFTGQRRARVQQAVRAVDVQPDRVQMTPASNYPLSAAAFDERGFTIQGLGFGWSSHDGNIANVDGSGTLSAGNVDDSTYVVADAFGVRDSSLVRVAGLATLCEGGTAHDGETIDADVTWATGSRHCIAGIVHVAEGATLTILDAVRVEFAPGARLRLGFCCNFGRSGQLTALGNAGNPVTFTALSGAAGRGQWSGIDIAWLDVGERLELNHTVIEYAGQNQTAAIQTAGTCNGTVRLDNVTIRETSVQGINLSTTPMGTACDLDASSVVIEDNTDDGVVMALGSTRLVNGTVRRNGGDGIDLAAGTPGALTDLAGTVVTENGGRAFLVDAQSHAEVIDNYDVGLWLGNGQDVVVLQSDADITGSDLFWDGRIDWQVTGTFAVGGNHQLTIGAGARVLLGQLYIGIGSQGQNIGAGRLIADGTDTEPIVFTSPQSNPQSGDWTSIKLNQTTGQSVLRNVIVEYGGGLSGSSQPMLNASGAGGTVLLDRVTALYSAGTGIRADRVDIQSTIRADSNGQHGLHVVGQNVVVRAGSQFMNNGDVGIFTESSASNFQVDGSVISDNACDGIRLNGHNTSITNNTISGNSCSGIVQGGQQNPDNTVVRGNVISANGGDGIQLGGAINSTVEDNQVFDNANHGIEIANGGMLSGNRVWNNEYPVRIVNAFDAFSHQDQDSLLGNRRDTLIVDCCGGISTPDTVRTRAILPWRVGVFAELSGGAVWEIEAGATLDLGNGSGFTVNDATVRALGRSDSIIRFIGENSTPGSWGCLDFQARRDTSILRHVEFRYGGSCADGTGNRFTLRIGSATSNPVILDSVRVTQSLEDAIHVDDETVLIGVVADTNQGRGLLVQHRDIVIEEAKFIANQSEGLKAKAGAINLTLLSSVFTDNVDTGMRLQADSVLVEGNTVTGNGTAGIEFSGDPDAGGNLPEGPVVRGNTVTGNLGFGIDAASTGRSTIDSNYVANNTGVGIRTHHGKALSRNLVTGNAYPLSLGVESVGTLPGQSYDSLVGNVGDTILIESDCCGVFFSTDTIRTTKELPWRIDANDFRLTNNSAWKIEPGAHVIANGPTIHIGAAAASPGGTLIAESDGDPIVFTSIAKTPGSWGGIWFEAPADTSRLKNVEVRYGGGSGQSVWVTARPIPPIFDSVRVLHGSGVGFFIEDGAAIFRRYVAADTNAGHGIELGVGNVTLPAVRARNNGGSGIRIYSGQGQWIDAGVISENAGYGVELTSGPIRFTNNLVQNNGGDGVWTSGGTTTFFTEFSGNTITGNSGYPLVLDATSLGPFAAQDPNQLLGNGRDTLCICSGGDFAFSTGSPTVTAALPWYNQVEITVDGDQTLTLDPGAVMIMENGSGGLVVGQSGGAARGRLLALGTAANPVRITGRDTTAGFWKQLSIENQSDSSVLRHVEVAFGGDGILQQLFVGDLAGLVIRLDTVTSRNSQSDGVWFGGGPFRVNALAAINNGNHGAQLTGGSLTITDSRFQGNAGNGILVDGGGTHVIRNSVFTGHTQWGLRNDTGSPVDAMMNWWGDASGPSGQGPGSGDAVSIDVDFSNWLLIMPSIP